MRGDMKCLLTSFSFSSSDSRFMIPPRMIGLTSSSSSASMTVRERDPAGFGAIPQA